MRRTALRVGLAAVCVVAFVAATAAAADAPAPGGAAEPSPLPQTPAPQSPAGNPPANAAATPTGPAQPPPPPETKSEPPASSQPAPPSAQGPAPAAPAPPPPSSEKPPPPSPPASKPPPAPPPTKSVLDKHLILGILGKEVKSAKGEGMGRIIDVIVDWTGQTRAAIIDFGGFLGVGSRRIAVAWNALHFEPEQKGDQITLDLARDQVKAAPEYKEGQPVVVLGPSGATEPIPYD